MSGYEVEHNLPTTAAKARSRRPDLSSFYSLCTETYGDRPVLNPTAQPTPENLTAVHRMLADLYETMLTSSGGENPLLQEMIDAADAAARDQKGGDEIVPDTLRDELERVDKRTLGTDESCPICQVPFLEDEFPLVVRLPCGAGNQGGAGHKFDLECVWPWVKARNTCPMDRSVVWKSRKDREKEIVDSVEDEEGWDEMYA